MQIVYKQVAELFPYVNNARKNDHAVDAVASSIKNYGFKQPIVIDSFGEVVAGHTRLKAAKKLGLETVPCIVADDLTPAQIKAYRIADNKVADLSDWDMELLKIELADIDDFTGFELEDLYEYNEKNEVENVIIEQDGKNPSELMERYMNSSIRQIILTFDQFQYEKIMNCFDLIQQEYNLNNNTECVIKLLEMNNYECN